MPDLQRTPLFDTYKKYGAKTIDFGGWEMPVQFSGIKKEHEAVRTKAGLFDVSHMGEIAITGNDSDVFLQKMMTNDISKLRVGFVQYTPMCYEDGGVVDDLLIYKLAENHYLLVVNAANTEKDVEWLKKHAVGDVTIENVSAHYCLLAIQGPKAESILQKLTPDSNLSAIKPFQFEQKTKIDDEQVLLSRTGYTGEDGFEIYCKPTAAVKLWNAILRAGENDGLIPCGLGARDTLRFEATLVLYGQELSPDISPLEAGLDFAVKLNKKEPFKGKDALLKQKEKGLPRKLIGIEMIERGIPRTGYEVFVNGQKVGEVTSGTQSPTLKKNIGLALIKTAFAKVGQQLEVKVRKKLLKASVVPTPFYQRGKK